VSDGKSPEERIEEQVPELAGSDYQVQSPRTRVYNCFAWAGRRSDEWWEPPTLGSWTQWPAEVPALPTLGAYQATYESYGFATCADGTVEAGYERIAIFVDGAGDPCHAARQLPSGRWTSKLGSNHDIEHELHALDGSSLCGSVALFMKRRCPGPPPAPAGGVEIASEMPASPPADKDPGADEGA
jgi:hypothetical protein